MAITAHTAIVGCVLPAAALVLVATFYFFTRRKKSTGDNRRTARVSELVAKRTEEERTDVVEDTTLRQRHRYVSEDVISQPEENVVDSEIEGLLKEESVIEKDAIRDSAERSQGENVSIEELFKSAKASLEVTSAPCHNDVTDSHDVPDEEVLRKFMTSLMSPKSDDLTPVWSSEDAIANEEAQTVDAAPSSLNGAGDGPPAPPANQMVNNNISRKRDDKEYKRSKENNKKKVDKTKPDTVKKENKKKPEVKKEIKKKGKEEVCDKKSQEKELNHHPRIHSDSVSEVSSDSGNGNSVVEQQSLSSPSNNTITCYQFEFPSRLCGKFVGKSGRNINQIKNASGCQITLLQHPFYNPEYQICTLDGTEDEVANALGLIQEKFPASRYADITYEPFQVVRPETANPVISLEMMELRLIDGIYNDVLVSSVVDASQFFVQQPAHPSFPSLESLNLNMNACYNQDPSVPTLPTPVEAGVICAAPLLGGWYRAQILDWQEGVTEVDVKYVDYGGYGHVRLDDLKQIRSDFMTVPFQACECYLANVAPLEGEDCISLAASALLEELTQACVLQCEIVTYDETTKVPYVYLYKMGGNQVKVPYFSSFSFSGCCCACSVIVKLLRNARDERSLIRVTDPNSQNQFINRELVDRGVVRWLE